jgi:Tol biopolymer transport system component
MGRSRRRMALSATVLVGLVATGCEPPGPTASWRSELVSVNGAGTAGSNQVAGGGVLSPDGTKVLFVTSATDMGFPDLVPGTSQDIYMRDLVTGQTHRITQTPDGTDGGNGVSGNAVFTPDGSTIVLSTSASNLGPVDTNGASDIYAYDLAAGAMRLLTAGASGTGANGASRLPDVSPAGRTVAFRSAATDLGPVDTDGGDDIYVLDIETGESQLVSVTTSGAAAGGLPNATSISFSDDGRYLTFISSAPGIVELPPPGANAYLRDLATQTTTLVSIGTGGTALPPGFGATAALIDPTGQRVAFVYRATSATLDQLYLRELASETTTLVSRRDDAPGNGSSRGPAFAPDGSRLAFTSAATNLASDDLNERNDAFVYDVAADVLTLVSYDLTGEPSNSVSQAAGFSPDGRKLAFVSSGANIVAGFPAVSSELYLRELDTGRAEMVSLDPSGTAGGNFVFSAGRFAPDGRTIVFLASSSTLDGRPVLSGVPSVFIARLVPDLVADLEVSISRRAQPAEGTAWTVDVTAANDGPSTATAIRLGYFLPYVGAGSTVSTSDGTCTTSYGPDGSTIFDCTLGALAPGQTRTIAVSNPFPLSPSPQESVAHVSGPRLFDPDGDDNTATLVLDTP